MIGRGLELSIVERGNDGLGLALLVAQSGELCNMRVEIRLGPMMDSGLGGRTR